MKIQLLLTTLAVIFFQFAHAQVARTSDLFISLKKQDSIFFEKSFNQCDMAYLEAATHKDLIFYHDRGGIQNKAQFLEAVQKNICGNTARKPIRKPDENSLEVFPLYNNNVLYGVIQNGIHHFYIREANKPDVLTGKARFTHLYLLENDKWILREVFSFDHQ